MGYRIRPDHAIVKLSVKWMDTQKESDIITTDGQSIASIQTKKRGEKSMQGKVKTFTCQCACVNGEGEREMVKRRL